MRPSYAVTHESTGDDLGEQPGGVGEFDSLGLGLTVTSAPLQVSTSVLYSGASSASHQATTAQVTATVAGGVAPFSYNWSIAGSSLSYGQASSNAIPPYSLSATAANTVTLTITDSSSPQQTTTLSAPVAAGPRFYRRRCCIARCWHRRPT